MRFACLSDNDHTGAAPHHRWAARLPAVVCLVASLALTAVVQSAYRERDLLEQQQRVRQQLQVMRDRLVAQAQISFSPTAGLSTLIQTDGSISQERFAQLVERSLTLVPYIRSVVAAPDDVARYVHPMAGNERVLNLDYRSVPVQWAQVQRARSVGSPIIVAPVKLVQGGVAAIQRNPVFLRDGPSERYWGVVSVVVDLDRFLGAGGIGPNDELDLLLTNPAAPPDQFRVWGTAQELSGDTVQTTVSLPGAQWVLSAHPKAGWSQPGWARETWAVFAGGLLVSVLLGLLGRQTQHLRLRHLDLAEQMRRSEYDRAALHHSQKETGAVRDRLQAVLDAATEVAVISTDLGGQVTVFNRGAERMLGYQESEVLGQTPALWHDQDQIRAVGEELASAASSTAPQGFSVFVQLADSGAAPRSWFFITRAGQRLEVSLALSTVLGLDGQPVGYLGIARDLSAQRSAETALRQLSEGLEQRVQERTAELRTALDTLQQAQETLLRTEKLAALGGLVAGVAHELNTPIGNSLITASTLAERTVQIRQEMQSGQMKRSSFDAYLNDAHEASDLLLRGLQVASEMVQHFKQLAADQTSEQRRRFELESVVSDVLALSRVQWKSTPYRIETELAPIPTMDSYPGALGRVLGNLLQNALLHAFEGRDHGVVRISASLADTQTVQLEVVDDGLGMEDEVQRRAFDPFFTTKLARGGTGLGLNIVHNTVTSVLGGRLELVSHPGTGTRFIVRLPLVAPRIGAE